MAFAICCSPLSDVPGYRGGHHHARVKAAEMLKAIRKKILPTLVLEHMPFVAQVIFFGALLSAIKSCASATLLCAQRDLRRKRLSKH